MDDEDRVLDLPPAEGTLGRPAVDDDIISDMIARRQAGQTFTQIAAAHGYMNEWAVRYALRRHGAPPAWEVRAARKASRRAQMLAAAVGNDIISDMLASRLAGQTLTQIAAAYGYTNEDAVRDALRQRGAPPASEVRAARRARRSTEILTALASGGDAQATESDDRKLSRDIEILRARAAGATLTEMGKQFGLSTERVRQIVNREGGPKAAQLRAGRASRKIRRREELAVRIHTEIQRAGTTTAAAIADTLGVLKAEVLDAIREEDARRIELPKRRSAPYSDQSILEGLRVMSEHLAAEEPTEGITSRAVSMSYWDAHRDPDLVPTAQRIAQRFGGWSQACLAAGIPSRPQRSDPRRWTDDELVGWLARFLDSSNDGRTQCAYSAWTRGTPGAPSADTVRRRLGGWSNALRRAIPFPRG